jgi:hypothetical protein
VEVKRRFKTRFRSFSIFDRYAFFGSAASGSILDLRLHHQRIVHFTLQGQPLLENFLALLVNVSRSGPDRRPGNPLTLEIIEEFGLAQFNLSFSAIFSSSQGVRTRFSARVRFSARISVR